MTSDGIIERRLLLKGALGFAAAWCLPSFARARQGAGVRRLTDRLALANGFGSNVLVLETGDGLVLVDSGAPEHANALAILLGQISDTGVGTVFNTHYHLAGTGANERFGQAGARIVAHENTRLWMATPYWVPAEDRYQEARPAAAHPTETFYQDGSLLAGSERIEYGYLIEAHTNGDIYVFFRDSNVLAAGDVVSPARDPELDWFTGAWLGGRIDAMDRLLAISDAETRIVSGYGPPIGRRDLQAERDMMATIYERTVDRVRQGETVRDMLEAGVLDGLARTWDDPYKFLYDVHKGLWAHHNKLAPNVV